MGGTVGSMTTFLSKFIFLVIFLTKNHLTKAKTKFSRLVLRTWIYRRKFCTWLCMKHGSFWTLLSPNLQILVTRNATLIFFNLRKIREGGNIGLFTLVFKVLWKGFLICWLNNFGKFYWILISWFIKLSVQTFQPLIVIYNRRNFVYPHRGCTSMYWPLSYLFKSLIALVVIAKILKIHYQMLSLNQGLYVIIRLKMLTIVKMMILDKTLI